MRGNVGVGKEYLIKLFNPSGEAKFNALLTPRG